MLRGVVFDMDGVIVDSHAAHRRAWQQFLRTLGKDVPEEKLNFILEGRKREEILRHFLGDLSPEQVAEYGKRKDEMLRKVEPNATPIRGVIQFLELLSANGIKIAVATSASKDRTLGTLDCLGVSRYFSAVVTGCDVPKGKPDPAAYRLAAQRLALAPEELLALEDAVSGVRAARTAGLKCVAVASNGQAQALLDAGADHVLPDFVGMSLARLQTLWAAIETKRAGGESHLRARSSAFSA